jgi:hypothetical protein
MVEIAPSWSVPDRLTHGCKKRASKADFLKMVETSKNDRRVR